ncbi:hypothetical protein C8Q73DRAFT_634641 [Cubamyces lactineus]|nr:hypothetical protein C8Q73DRAFT_634641 [Cubamyces lactineus]
MNKTRFDAPLPSREKPRWRKDATQRGGLNLTPSSLCPACAASDQLLKWVPIASRRQRNHNENADKLSDADLQRISDVSAFAWETSTLSTYGSGLLVYHVFCDLKGIPEPQRAPASEVLILAFIAAIAGLYALSAISNYVAGVCAWHILHGFPWAVDRDRYKAALTGAAQLAPATSKRPARVPLPLETLRRLAEHFDLSKPLDAAVWACLCISFFSLARLGELTVQTQKSFRLDAHPSRAHIRREHHRDGSEVYVVHLPRTKSAPRGEDILFGKQQGIVDPWTALENHLAVNALASTTHIFAYRKSPSNAIIPLTRRAFTTCLKAAAAQTGVPDIPGHSLRIGGTLEYLLRGISFETVKAIGHWQSDAFTLYLRKHAQILAPYLQDQPEVLSELSKQTIQLPPVR